MRLNAHMSLNLELHQPFPPHFRGPQFRKCSQSTLDFWTKEEKQLSVWLEGWGGPNPPRSFPSRHPCISSHGPKSRLRAVRRASCQGNRSAEILAALDAQLFKSSLHSLHICPSIPSPLPRGPHGSHSALPRLIFPSTPASETS